MPNSPIQRRADAPIPPPVSANKIVRGAAQQQVLETRVDTSTQSALPTGSSGGGGGGPPSGAAGGDLAGSYPNPTLAAIGGGSIGPLGSDTRVPVVTRDAKGRVTGLTDIAISFPTSLPPSGSAGGRLAGSYPNPTFAAFGPGAGTKGTQVRYPSFTLDAAGTVSAWSDFAARPYEFNVKDYGCAGDGSTDDTTNFQAAITAAAAVHGIVRAPYGVYRITAALTLPGGFTGYLSFRGDGLRASIIRQDSAAHGLDLDFSAAGDGGVQIQDLGVMANSSGCLAAVKLTGAGSSTYSQGSMISRVEVNANGVNSTGWNQGFDFIGCYNLNVEEVFAYGNASNYVNSSGAGGGACMRFTSCVNCYVNGLNALFWNYGPKLPTGGSLGHSEGVCMTQIILLECLNICYVNASGLYLNNFVFDNGNLNVAHEGIQVLGGATAIISNGQILQRNGANQIKVDASNSVTITNVDLSPRNSVSGASVLFTNTASCGIVQGCLFGAGNLEVQCDSGTAGTRAVGNTNSGNRNNSDAGSNRLGDAMSFTGVVTTPNPAISTSYNFTVNITDAGLGRFIAATIGNMSDDIYKFRIDQSASTVTSLAVVLTLFTGLTLGAGQTVRYGATVAP